MEKYELNKDLLTYTVIRISKTLFSNAQELKDGLPVEPPDAESF